MLHRLFIIALASLFFAIPVHAQPQREAPPQFESPDVSQSETITFKLHAPNAEAVTLNSPDIRNLGDAATMTKDDEGVWSTEVKSVQPGAYRYRFNVDGLMVIDPRNPSSSQSNMNTWSLAYLSGAEFMDANQVPHGAVAEVYYNSNSLDRMRRMHVYTPPGYEKDDKTYPVFYLLHGAFDCDDSWSTVGRAGFIIDNLIASGKAKPMIVVMPAGHTGPWSWGMPLPMGEFVEDFKTDIRPYVEANYRVKTGRESRAIAGLSMGGAHTLNIAFPDLGDYAYIGVYSSGIFGIDGRGPGGGDGPSWEEQHKEILSDDSLKEELELVWFAIGKDDFLLETSRMTVEMLRENSFEVVEKETDGGHDWINWRDYLNEFAQQLF